MGSKMGSKKICRLGFWCFQFKLLSLSVLLRFFDNDCINHYYFMLIFFCTSLFPLSFLLLFRVAFLSISGWKVRSMKSTSINFQGIWWNFLLVAVPLSSYQITISGAKNKKKDSKLKIIEVDSNVKYLMPMVRFFFFSKNFTETSFKSFFSFIFTNLKIGSKSPFACFSNFESLTEISFSKSIWQFLRFCWCFLYFAGYRCCTKLMGFFSQLQSTFFSIVRLFFFVCSFFFSYKSVLFLQTIFS